MFRKFLIGVVLFPILAAACAPAPPATSVSPVISPTPFATQPTPSIAPSLIPATVAVVVPKQRDLIFVEFFAVT